VKGETDGGALTLSHVNGVDGMLFEVAKGDLVVRTGMGDSGSGSNLKEKGRATIWPGVLL
jgi:flagellar basal body P-ring protein FlgI